MSERPGQDRVALVFVLGLFLFCSPLTGWWTSLALPWFAIFVPWGVVIALAALVSGRQDRP